VYRWLEGEPVAIGRVADRGQFAAELADFLAALHRVDPSGGPPPGLHNFFRGGPLTVYHAETIEAITALGVRVDAGRVAAAGPCGRP
jgi:aminoglycoside phosphotransferase (APT) family kinase protein